MLSIDGCVGDTQAFALVVLFCSQFGKAGVDLRLPLTKTFAGLRKLQRFNLQRVCPVLQRSHFLARFVQALLRFGEAPLYFAEAPLCL